MHTWAAKAAQRGRLEIIADEARAIHRGCAWRLHPDVGREDPMAAFWLEPELQAVRGRRGLRHRGRVRH